MILLEKSQRTKHAASLILFSSPFTIEDCCRGDYSAPAPWYLAARASREASVLDLNRD